MKLKEIQLSCKNLSFSYGKGQEPVFSGLSLTVGKGEAVLLMGPSGCGKSTLAYCLAGLYPEYAGELEGEIFLEGEALSSYGPARRAKTVSILFQNPDNQFCMERVEHEVLFALENINYQGDMRARTEKLLEQVGLAAWASYPIRTLSGGMKQKLALATALATGARLLILDEPFANLDPGSCAALADLLGRMNRQGLTLLVVDHRFDWWKPFLSRILLFQNTGSLDETAIRKEEIEDNREEFVSRGLFYDDGWLADKHPPEILPDAKPMVRAEGITLFHDRKPFLEDISFEIPKGSVTALVGSCGSGKTTLLHAIAGAGRCRGRLMLGGKAGLVFQNPRFQFLRLSVEEEILLTLRTAKPKELEEKRKERADALLLEFGLLEWKKQSPYALSQGQQRRLALLAMLAGDCPLMLLDEPTYAQDERSTRFIWELLERRVSQGLTVVMATHDLALARACSNQVLLLEDGKLKKELL